MKIPAGNSAWLKWSRDMARYTANQLSHYQNVHDCSPVLREFQLVIENAGWRNPIAREAGVFAFNLAKIGSANCLNETALARRLIRIAKKLANPYTFNIDEVLDVIGPSNFSSAYVAAISIVRSAKHNGTNYDETLAKAYDGAVKVLIDLEAPGVCWLHAIEGKE